MNDGRAFCIDSFEVRNLTQRRRLAGIFSALGFLMLILDSKTAISGAADGVELCLRTVIPALFPFFVVSSVLLQCENTSPTLHKLSLRVAGLPNGADSLLLPCFLGGYPVGAQSVYQMYANGRIPKQEAERLLAFCNNAGPAFLFGMAGQVFQAKSTPWILWAIHIIGALTAARCVPATISCTDCGDRLPIRRENLMRKAIATMGTVCGWIVLFRVLIAFLDRWFFWLLPQGVRIAFVGLLELSNGCCELEKIADPSARFILCSVMLAAGGICVTAQTNSVTPGLSLRCYGLGKMIQIAVSLMLSFCVTHKTVLPLALFLPLLPLVKKSAGKKKVSVV